VAGKINQTITFAQPEAKTVESPAFRLEASVNSGRSVTFATSPSSSSVCAVGEASGIVNLLGAGECVIIASSPGTGSYADAPEVTRSFTVSAVAPGVPSLTSVSGQGGTMTIGFVPPGNNGGSEITGYQAIATPTDGSDPVVQECGPVSPCVMGGLDENLEYEVTLKPINGAGIGETASDPSPAITPSPASDETVSELRTTNGDGEMTVTWAEPLSFGGDFEEYQVFIRESGTQGWPPDPAETITDSSAQSATLSDLVNGTSYDVKIVVVTDQVSEETISLGVAAKVPGPPTDLTLEVLSMTSVFASWSAPTDNGGSSITGYPISPSCTPENATDTFCVITGLTPGSTVTVRVAASNVVGSSSSASAAVTLPAPPSPPAPAPSPSDGGGSGGAGGEPPVDSVTVPDEVLNGAELSAVLVNGSLVRVQMVEDPALGEMEVVGPDFMTRVRTEDASGAPVPMGAGLSLMVPQGGRVVASGDGFMSNSSVRAFMVPRNPVQTTGFTGRAATGATYLGEAIVADAGDFSATFVVPFSVTVGDYVLQLNGVTLDDSVRSVNMQVQVSPGAAPLEAGKAQRAGFFKGTSDEFSKAGKRKLRSLVRALPLDAQAVQVLIGGVSVSLDSFEANVTLAGKRASTLASELRDRGVSGEFVVNVTSTFTVDAAERALAEKADVLTTKAGKPLSTVTILFQEPVGS